MMTANSIAKLVRFFFFFFPDMTFLRRFFSSYSILLGTYIVSRLLLLCAVRFTLVFALIAVSLCVQEG